MAAASAYGYGHRLLAGENLRIVIAGAGIVGASIAYHLAKSGASVTILDKEGPASHASRGTFAWINATWAKQPRSYHALNQDSLANWRDLQHSLGLPIRWGGSLEWFDDAQRQQKLVAQIAEQAAWGEKARMIEPAEMKVLEPSVDFAAARLVALSENDGAVDPVLATQALLQGAQGMGATVQFPCELTGVSQRGDRLVAVTTSLGEIEADRLVLATGAAPDTASRFANVDVPQRTTPGVIAITVPMPQRLKGIVVAPGIHMHQRDDGRIVLGEQDGPPQNSAHALRLDGRPNAFPNPDIASQHAARMLTVAQRFIPGIAGAAIEDVYIGWRPLPIDGHPVLGFSPARRDVYLAIMHSGVSLAPIVGQLAAYELIGGPSVDRLEEFRPGRKFELVKRY